MSSLNCLKSSGLMHIVFRFRLPLQISTVHWDDQSMDTVVQNLVHLSAQKKIEKKHHAS